jgi:Leucine-rich repeat (LRR) protein
LFCRLTFLTFADIIASESYQYFKDGGYGPHNVSESSEDNGAKLLICVKSPEKFERMVFLNNYQNLETIDANTCRISQIDYDLHVKGTSNSIYLTKLHTLDLSHNNITYIKKHCFYSLQQNLKTLILSNNIITKFAPQAFSHLNNLQTLDLSNNNISFINESSFKDLHQLKNFSVANNNLLKLDVKLFKSTKLQTLNFRQNNISMINLFTSSVWNDLMILDLNLTVINEQIPTLKIVNFSVPLPQLDHSIKIKNLTEKYNQMLWIVLCVSSIFSIVAIILTVKLFCKNNYNDENHSKSIREAKAQSPIEINPIYESMMME